MFETRNVIWIEEVGSCLFKLQNVITFPYTCVSLFTWENVYNLTSYVSKGKRGCCAKWYETMCRLSSNDIGSTVFRMLTNISFTDLQYTNYIFSGDSWSPKTYAV